MVEYRMLGPLEVRGPDGVVVSTSAGQRLLLALLLVAGDVVSADRLIDALWGDAPPADPAAALRSQLARLRRVLGPAARDLVAEGGGYRLWVKPGQVDADRFEDLVAAARRAGGDQAIDLFDRALGLWRGPALAEFVDRPFAQPEAVRLEQLQLIAREEHAERLLSLGRVGDALVSLEALVTEHPEREQARALLMQALYRHGRHTDALARYQSWRRYLAEELGLEPSPALQRLEVEILRHRLISRPCGGQATRPTSPATAGPLTFLLTDIEGSTRRWEAHQDTMAADLVRHDQLLRQVIERHGGTVFKHTGDGCCAVFPTASTGLVGAVAAQLALAGETWGPGAPLRARMALHTGTAQPRGDDWFGPTLNRAARLLTSAHGGQIVMSLTTEELALDDPPAGIGWVDLGEHQLAGLERPHQVFQVTHAGLQRHFPPLRSLGTHRHNLPAALSPFVGRLAELDAVAQLLTTARLLSLTGVGGAGKTRLALEAAARARPDFADGIFLVELAGVRDSTVVARQVATAIGLAVDGADTPAVMLDRLCRYLEPRRMLLVLDNCEHLVGSAAGLAEAILGRAPNLVILATSREPLGLSGEVVWRVPPLSLPPSTATTLDDLGGADAVTLFCQRARHADPAFTLGSANAAAVAQICRRLDGIPLALELAAARLRLLTPEQIVRRLDDCFRLLGCGSRVALPQHQTLAATMDWSYRLLSDTEQITLRRLAVFPGTFSFDAAEAVIADGHQIQRGDVLDLLGYLVDKSLVVFDPLGAEGRYRLLETVRQYAAERLTEANETPATRRRHRDFFLASANATHDDLSFWWDTRGWLARVRIDQHNFSAALEWSWTAGEPEECLRLALALSYYWLLDGGVDAKQWLQQSLDATVGATSPARVRGLACLAAFAAQAGEPTRAVALLDEARALAARINDVTGVGLACELLGGLRSEAGEYEPAEQLLDEAGRCFQSAHCLAGQWGCHYDLGWIAVARGDPGRAAQEFERALTLGRRCGSEDLIAHALAALAPVAALTGDTKRAEALAAEAIEITRRLALRLFVVMALTRAAEVTMITSSIDRAQDTLAEALILLRDVGGHAWVSDALELTALMAHQTDRTEDAARLFGATDKLTGARPPIRTVRNEVDACRAAVAHQLGDKPFAAALAQGQQLSADQAITEALATLAQTSDDHGQDEETRRGPSLYTPS